MRRRLSTIALLALASCWDHDPAPRYPQLGPSGGYAPDDFDFESACRGDWTTASADVEAQNHISFPELATFGCFVPVEYDPVSFRITGLGPTPPGCEFPTQTTPDVLRARAAVYEAIAARGDLAEGQIAPLELACHLPAKVRKAAAAANARTLRSYADSIGPASPSYPYAIAGTFGYGNSVQNESKLLEWTPADACIDLDAAQLDLLDVNVPRASRIAEAYRAGVAPLVSTSGGAVHGKVYEAFMLAHLAHCRGGVPIDRILVDPCADHTHTNIRNTGALVRNAGARFAYLVTDDFLQSKYMQEWTTFDSIGGSIDARALRDWGYLIGSWRQASRGIAAGFWFTPYRFWAEVPGTPAAFSCAGDIPYSSSEEHP